MNTEKARTRLAALKIATTSVVDHPANGVQVGGEGWLVMKADGSPVSVEVAEAIETLKKNAPEKEPEVADEMTIEKALDALEPETAAVVKAALEAKDTEIAAATTAREAAEKAAAEAKPVENDERSDLEKALDDPATPDSLKAILKSQHDAVVKAQADATAAEAVAKAEQDKRVSAEFVTKAEGLDGLAIAAPELGPILKAVHENTATPEQLTELDRVLQGASDVGKAATLLTEIGRTGSPAAGSAWEQVDKAAQEFRKANPEVSIEKAREQVQELDPELAARVKQEQKH